MVLKVDHFPRDRGENLIFETTRLTCPPEKGPFFKGHESSSNHQFSGDMSWFSGGVTVEGE